MDISPLNGSNPLLEQYYMKLNQAERRAERVNEAINNSGGDNVGNAVATLTASPAASASAAAATASPVAEPPAVQSVAPLTATEISNTVQRATNVEVLQSSAIVSIGAGGQAEELLYRTTVDHINELLAPQFGPDAVGTLLANGFDASPQATADRILAASLSFYDPYRMQHPGMEAFILMEEFIDTLRLGFALGFYEAVHILDGLGVLGNEAIAMGLETTYALVEQGYDNFLQNTPPSTMPSDSMTSTDVSIVT